jgi:hypothetical protein
MIMIIFKYKEKTTKSTLKTAVELLILKSEEVEDERV